MTNQWKQNLVLSNELLFIFERGLKALGESKLYQMEMIFQLFLFELNPRTIDFANTSTIIQTLQQ